MRSIPAALVVGTLIVLAGTIPRNLTFAANFRFATAWPWAVPVMAAYLWWFWRYLEGYGPPAATQAYRRVSLRANRISGPAWVWAIVAGSLGLVALVIALRVANRLVVLPPQQLPDLPGVPTSTVWTLLLAGAPIAGLVEEAAFRGYMQGAIEERHGFLVAIIISGTMFALMHLDFTPILWPYYIGVSAVYGGVVFLTDSVWPSVVLHTMGNLYSTTDLLLHGRSDWQAGAGASELVWRTGMDGAFVGLLAALVVSIGVAAWAYSRLARLMGPERTRARARAV